MSRRTPRRPGGTLRDGERRQLALASRRAAQPDAEPPPPGRPRVLCDGGSRGNPGPAAIAAVLLDAHGETIERRATPIGRATAAEAEYRALLLGVELAAAHGIDEVDVCSDSKLAIAGVTGTGPAQPGLAALAAEARAAAKPFGSLRWTWHPRARNRVVDDLVRELLWR
jgi:ribonuclease HI